MDDLNWDGLLARSSSWAHAVSCPEKTIDDFAYRPPGGKQSLILARIMRGRRCGTKRELFQEWAAALQFPYYFGGNWDAFEECINDLDWIPMEHFVFFVTHTSHLLHTSERDFATFAQIMSEAARRGGDVAGRSSERVRVAYSFHVVFHCEPGDEAETWSRFLRVGIAI